MTNRIRTITLSDDAAEKAWRAARDITSRIEAEAAAAYAAGCPDDGDDFSVLAEFFGNVMDGLKYRGDATAVAAAAAEITRVPDTAWSSYPTAKATRQAARAMCSAAGVTPPAVPARVA